MYAVIETGGKQYKVSEGDVITVEKLNAEAGENVEFDKVLAIGEGKDISIGTPYVDAVVTGKILEHGKGKKLVIYKYKAKKDYRKKQGHRQPYTSVEIVTVSGNNPGEKNQTETVSEVKPHKSLKSMKKAELIEFAEENGIELDTKATNAVMIETIEAALK